MSKKQFMYKLLLTNPDSFQQDQDNNTPRISEKWRIEHKPSISKKILVVFAFIMLLLNGVWVLLYIRKAEYNSAIETNYFNSTTHVHKAFHWNTPFNENNKTISNPLWQGLFPSGAGLVTVENSWAQSEGLPMSMENPYYKDESVYFVAALHQLHCLTVIRASLFHFNEAKTQTVPWKHVTHCLDSLRQVIMCKMDSTLLYTEDGNVFGDGQIHHCGDWKALTLWASEHAFI